MNKNLIKKLIIILTVIIIVLIIAIMLFKDETPAEKDEQNDVIQQSVETEEIIVTSHEEKERIYTVEQCVSAYLDIINTNNSAYYMQDESGNQQKFVNEDEKILNVLSEEYINENNITKENVSNYIQKLDKDVFFIPLQMNSVNSDDMYKYAVSGYITDLDYNFIENVAFIVNLDIGNLTYSIEPINEEFDNIKDIQLNITVDSIAENEDNIVQYITTNTEEDCKRYLDNYKKIALSNPEEAYNKLDEEYRNKRFGSLEAYEQYIEENREDMEVVQLSQYMINDDNGETQYVCRDAYGKLYVFEGENILNTSIQLDTYTIENNTFKEQYENGNEQTKVQMNINKFILMINNQDYQAAYNVLDDDFKNNYFATIDDFKNYLQLHSYKYNDMEANSFDVTGNVYSCGVTLTDLTNGLYVDESKGTGGSGYAFNWNFYVQLNDGTDFKLSFEVNQ